ncbi:hypothetical protein GCM10028791_33120 [Echinicola sediminis]
MANQKWKGLQNILEAFLSLPFKPKTNDAFDKKGPASDIDDAYGPNGLWAEASQKPTLYYQSITAYRPALHRIASGENPGPGLVKDHAGATAGWIKW